MAIGPAGLYFQTGSNRSRSAWQEGIGFVLGSALLGEREISQGCTVSKDVNAHSAGTVELWRKQVPTWDVFLMPSALNLSPNLGWWEKTSTEGSRSLLPLVLPSSAAWLTVHCPRTACPKVSVLYPPILTGLITVISIIYLRSPTQFHPQISMSHSSPPPLVIVINDLLRGQVAEAFDLWCWKFQMGGESCFVMREV